jgi:hypothetical protein
LYAAFAEYTDENVEPVDMDTDGSPASRSKPSKQATSRRQVRL